ncbi:hypothetical protein GINT2_001867 [Glugoides intestinalis]
MKKTRMRDMSMSTESYSSSEEDISNSSEDTASSSLDIEMIESPPEINSVNILNSQLSYIKDIASFIEKLHYCNKAMSGDMTLGISGVAKYEDVRGFLTKNFKKVVNSVIDNAGETPENVSILFTPRIINIPLQTVYKMYLGLKGRFNKCIVVSRLYTLDKDEFKEVKQDFPEFADEHIRDFPINNEQVFFLSGKYMKNTHIDETPARVYLIDNEEFDKFLVKFDQELSK